jgi:hypothetical protein
MLRKAVRHFIFVTVFSEDITRNTRDIRIEDNVIYLEQTGRSVKLKITSINDKVKNAWRAYLLCNKRPHTVAFEQMGTFARHVWYKYDAPSLMDTFARRVWYKCDAPSLIR